MKFLNKIDQYLIENHPLIWMTKLHYVLPISILVNLAFWFWGFSYIDLRALQHRISELTFFDSYAIYFYLLLVIMFLIIWAIAYFKKSAVRHLYPIKKFYFTRLLVLLFVNFLFIVTPYLSFRAGTNSKVGQLANYNDLKKELRMVNRAQAFLPVSIDDYDFRRLFELRNPEYRILPEHEWNGGEIITCDYDPLSHPENNDTINDNTIVQCIRTKRIINECDNGYYKCFSGFKKVPQQYIDLTTSVNYLVDEFIYFDQFNKVASNSFYDYYYYYGDYSGGSLRFNEQIKEISGSRAKIKKELDRFDAFLNKFDVPHAFNSNVIAQYFSKHKGEFLNAFVDDGLHDYEYQGYYYSNTTDYSRMFNLAIEKRKEQSRNTTLADLEDYNGTQSLFMVDNARLRNVFQNAKNAYYWKSFYIECMAMLLIALGLAFLFLMFSFADFIILVVTVPVTGVFIIINVLVCAVIYSLGNWNEEYLLFVPISFAAGISIWYTLNLCRKHTSRRVTHALGYLTGLISTLFFAGIAVLVVELTKTDVPECDYYQTKYIFLKEWIEDPGFVFILSAIGILLYTLTIKKLIAKPD